MIKINMIKNQQPVRAGTTKIVTKIVCVVALMAAWAIAGLGGAVALANTTWALGIPLGVICLVVATAICLKGISICARW
jgi:hypothetical protein